MPSDARPIQVVSRLPGAPVGVSLAVWCAAAVGACAAPPSAASRARPAPPSKAVESIASPVAASPAVASAQVARAAASAAAPSTAAGAASPRRARDLPPLAETKQCALSAASANQDQQAHGVGVSSLFKDPRFAADVPGPCTETIFAPDGSTSQVPYHYESGRFQDKGSAKRMFRRYDAHGHLLAFGDATTGKAWAEYHFDECGKLRTLDYFETRSYTYDDAGRLVRFEHPGHAGAAFQYVNGRLDVIVHGPDLEPERQDVVTLLYGPRGRVAVAEIADGNGRPLETHTFRYDDRGHVIEAREQILTNGTEQVESWTFDVRGRVTSRTLEYGEPRRKVVTRFDYACWSTPSAPAP